ncbi:MAG: SseB family protein [Flavobacteriales bacterium]|jgi:tetratricopeptide (TPR) repeat protein|nr:SseB family protein [Flavobacteriales bacterium]
MFGLFKKKQKNDYPANDLEQVLMEARTDLDARETFYTKLLWADLYVITDGSDPRAEGDATFVNFVALDTGHVPVFSSLGRIYDNGIIKEECHYLELRGQDLFEITKGASLVLNPYSDYPKELLPDEIEHLLNGTIYDLLKEDEGGLTQEEADQLNQLFEGANKRQEDLIYLDGFTKKSLSSKAEKKLRQSIVDFEQILEKCPDHWQSMFGMAKSLQRLGEHSKALELLEKAMELEKVNHFVALEASVEAVNLRNLEKALQYSEEALKRSPDSYVLLSNHALNLLVDGQTQQARETMDKAMEINSQDQVNKNVSNIIDEVLQGRRRRPTFDDLFSL